MSETPNLKQATLQVLVFIHNKLIASQFYPEEFAEADKSLRLIKDMAEKLNTEIQDEIAKAQAVQEIKPIESVVEKPKRGRKAKA